MVKKSFQWVVLLSCTMLLTGFRWPLYKTDIQQGNIITSTQCAQIKIGMSKEKIKQLLGSSVLTPNADQNCWEYINYYKTGQGKTTSKKITLKFEQGKLVDFHILPA